MEDSGISWKQLLAVGLWLFLRPPHTVRNEIAVLDLRGYSSERGEPSPSIQPPLDIPRATKHLILYLPIGSKEGIYDLAVLSPNGDSVLRATGTARLEDHIVFPAVHEFGQQRMKRHGAL